MKQQAIPGREQDILSAVVQTHISTGAPVPSAEIARRHGKISSATVRNVMVKLERAGYLQQPHTSAGRVPTLKAYDFFAQQMAARARLSSRDQHHIDGLMAGDSRPAEEMIDRAPHALSEFCRGVGILALSPLSQSVLDEIRFVPLSGQRVVVVAVTRSGLLRDKVVHTEEPYTREELERMTAYVNRDFRGWTLKAIRKEMERRVSVERSRILEQAFLLCEESFGSVSGLDSLHLEGVVRLLEQTGAADPEVVRNLLQALEEKQRLAQFLGECVEGPEAQLRILVGLEDLSPAMKDFTLIGTSCGDKERPLGWLGFLGPARMDYARAITAVRYVATLLDRTVLPN